METLRFIHCADLHLDRPFRGLADVPSSIAERVRHSTFRSFHRIVDAAIEREVDFVVIAGDLFDRELRSLRAQARFRDEMERLREAGIECFVIHGNHDPLGRDNMSLSWPDNVHVFSTQVGMIPFIKNGKPLAHLYGFSYPERAVTERMIRYYEKTDGATYHIGLLHGNVDGETGHDPYAPFTVSELLKKTFDYWALGHVHKRRSLHRDPPILYAGNIQGLNPKETGEKGCTLVEMEGRTTDLTFLPTAEIEWHAVNIPISGLGTADQLLEACEGELESLRRKDTGVLCTLQFSEAGPLHAFLQEDTHIDDLLSVLREGEEEKEHFVWPVSCQVHTTLSWDRDELKLEHHFIGDLLKLIDEQGADEAISPLYKNRQAKRFLSFSEQERLDILREAETLLLTELLREGD